MDLFTTDVMMPVVRQLKLAPSFFLDRYFPFVRAEASEEIHFDLDDRKRRVAPFVSPKVAGKVVASRGQNVKTFKPAYIKDKRIFDPDAPLKRTAGEAVGGDLTPADRIRVRLALELEDQLDMINRRLELMAAEALTSGQVTVSGDQYPEVVVDFLRDASLDVATPGVTWDNAATAVPLDDIADAAPLALKLSGVNPVDVIMDADAWKAFRNTTQVKDRMNVRGRPGVNIDPSAPFGEGATFMGDVDGFNIFVYQGWYVDPADDTTVTPFLASGTVIMAGGGPQGLAGIRAFGAIRDEQAGYMAVPYFPKSWVENDPSVRYLLMQSAPLVVPSRVDACLSFNALT